MWFRPLAGLALVPCTNGDHPTPCSTRPRSSPHNWVALALLSQRVWRSRGELANGKLAGCLASDFVTVYSPLMSRNRPDLAGFGRLWPEVQPGQNNWHPTLFGKDASNYVTAS